MKFLIFLCFTLSLTVTKAEEPVKVGAYPLNTTLCYKNIGCFTNNPPFNNTQGYLPEDPEYVNATFAMYTPQNKIDGRILSYTDIETIKNSQFNKILPLKIIIHGFFNSFDTPWLHNLKDSFLTLKYNVIIVGWGNGAKFPLYNNASSNTRIVGRELSIILDNITSVFFPNDRKNFKIHCIGHSLGSHVCGYAGHYSKLHDFEFDRISGLDPAGPFFEDSNELVRLDTGDAKFVDAYHSNAGQLVSLQFGIIAPIGHVDFYLNGGSWQPGCSTLDVGCSHSRAYMYFTESITSSCTFLGYKCSDTNDFINGKCGSCDNINDCAFAGYFTSPRTTGTYYVNTRDKAPFCGYHYVISFRILNDLPDPKKTVTAGEIILKVGNEEAYLTDINTEIKYGSEIVKYLVATPDFANKKEISITFRRKEKGWLDFFDKNGPGFFYDKLKVSNIITDEVTYVCLNKTQILDKQTNIHILSFNACSN